MIEIYYGYNDFPEDEQRIYQSLSEYRRRKADACDTIETRRQSLLAGYLLEGQLRDAGVQGELCYVESQRKKPQLKNQTLQFSISHCKKISTSVVAPWQVGIDAEQVGRGKMEIAERFFHPMEISLLQNQTDEIFQRFFCILWTLKEAGAKCLDVPLTEICRKFDCSGVVSPLNDGKTVRIEIANQEIFFHSYPLDDVVITCGSTKEEGFSLKRIDK